VQAGSSAAVPARALHSLPAGEKTPHSIMAFLQYFSDQVCEDVHRKIPQRISRTVPKKTCGGGASGGSGFPERQTSSGGGGGYRLTLFLGVFCPPN